MNIISKEVEGSLINFTSSNDKINVVITNDNNGPVFNLSDGSILRFSNMLQYYKVVTDNTLYNVNDESIDLDQLQNYLVDSDDADIHGISSVEEYNINGSTIYRFIA